MASAKPDDPPYLRAAFSLLGLSEIAGARHEKQILAMYAESGHPEVHDDETPWCAAFVGWCLHEAGLPNTNSLLARSYVKYGTPTQFQGFRVPRGAICVWTRDGGGHVNFCLEDDGKTLTCIGGNQSNNKGGGVTISRRSKSDGLVAAVIPPGRKIKPEPKPVPVPKPAPPPPDIEPPEPKIEPEAAPSPPGWFAKLRNWLGSLGGFGGLFALDWQLGLVLVGLVILAVAFLLWLFGREPIKAWIKRHFGGAT